MEASPALNRAVERSIERPAVSKVVAAVLRVSGMAFDLDRLI